MAVKGEKHPNKGDNKLGKFKKEMTISALDGAVDALGGRDAEGIEIDVKSGDVVVIKGESFTEKDGKQN